MINEIDNPERFNELSAEQQNVLLNWISDNLNPIKSFNENHTSYGLKHIFEAAANGSYVTNGVFKGAMLKSGYKVKEENTQNWCFNISEKSKCFMKKSI